MNEQENCHSCKYFFNKTNSEDVFICGLCSLNDIIINDADNEKCNDFKNCLDK